MSFHKTHELPSLKSNQRSATPQKAFDRSGAVLPPHHLVYPLIAVVKSNSKASQPLHVHPQSLSLQLNRVAAGGGAVKMCLNRWVLPPSNPTPIKEKKGKCTVKAKLWPYFNIHEIIYTPNKLPK